MECLDAGEGDKALVIVVNLERKLVASDDGFLSGVKNSPGSRNASPYTNSADDVCKYSLKDERIPKRTRGRVSYHYFLEPI